MNDPLSIPAALVRQDVGYLPLPNRVDLVLTDVLPPLELTPTSFIIGITEDDGIVLADHSRRGLEITGGHIDPGETPAQAARREGAEESGAEYATIWPIGYLRCVSEGTVPDDHPYPHPVGYQALHAAAVVSMEQREDYLECRRPVVLSQADIASLEDPFAEQLALLHAAALKAIGRDRSIEQLAAEARPTDEDDWGSRRQVDAENRFFDACRRLSPSVFAEGGDFSDWCLKATSEEMIDEALRILKA